MKWLKEFALLLVQLFVVCAFNKFILNVSNDFIFIDSAIAILLTDLVNSSANKGDL
jgi:hypothetical protein